MPHLCAQVKSRRDRSCFRNPKRPDLPAVHGKNWRSSLIGQKEIAVSFLRLASSGKVRQAYEKYIHPDFRHHNPYFKGDRESLLKGMEELAVVDWSKRDTTIAKVRLLVKRTARAMSIEIESDEPTVQKVVDWLAQNITGEEE